MRNVIIILLFVLLGASVNAQDNFKEIKSLTKVLDFEVGEKMSIAGVRTFINIETWEKSLVMAEIEVVSVHNEQTQAQQDLEAIHIVFEKSGSTVFFSNAIQIPEGKEKPKSNLKTILNLKVPRYAYLDISNAFGDLNLTGQIQLLDVDSEFCNNTVKNYTGTMSLDSKYDDIHIIDSGGKFEIDGNRSDLILNNVEGEVMGELEFGKMEVTYGKTPIQYQLETKYTPTSIYLRPGLEIYHEYFCENCEFKTDHSNEAMNEVKSKKESRITIGTIDLESKSQIKSESDDINIISIKAQANIK